MKLDNKLQNLTLIVISYTILFGDVEYYSLELSHGTISGMIVVTVFSRYVKFHRWQHAPVLMSLAAKFHCVTIM
jgi:hypothetical protein